MTVLIIILTILFLFCLPALAWRWRSTSALDRGEVDLSLPTEYQKSMDRTPECKTEPAFLKCLIEHDFSEESRGLQDSLIRADLNGRCIRRAIFLVTLLLMLSLAGLGYCAILLPDIFQNTKNVLMLGLCSLGLGSLISMGAFLGCLLWQRATVKRLYRKCRRLVLTLARSAKG